MKSLSQPDHLLSDIPPFRCYAGRVGNVLAVMNPALRAKAFGMQACLGGGRTRQKVRRCYTLGRELKDVVDDLRHDQGRVFGPRSVGLLRLLFRPQWEHFELAWNLAEAVTAEEFAELVTLKPRPRRRASLSHLRAVLPMPDHRGRRDMLRFALAEGLDGSQLDEVVDGYLQAHQEREATSRLTWPPEMDCRCSPLPEKVGRCR